MILPLLLMCIYISKVLVHSIATFTSQMKSMHFIMQSLMITLLFIMHTDIINTMDGSFTLISTDNDMMLQDISCKLSEGHGRMNNLYCAKECMDLSLSTLQVCGALRFDPTDQICTLCLVCTNDEQTQFVAFQNSTNIIWTRHKGTTNKLLFPSFLFINIHSVSHT